MPFGRLPTDPKTGRLQKHLMELKTRDVYKDLPSDARILLFHRANNAKADRINRIMSRPGTQDSFAVPSLAFATLQRKRQEKEDFSSAIQEAIRKKQSLKAAAAAEGVPLAVLMSRGGGNRRSGNVMAALGAINRASAAEPSTRHGLRPSTSAPAVLLTLVSPIERGQNPPSPAVFKYVPVKQKGVHAGELCNPAQTRLADGRALTCVQKFRRRPHQRDRGQGDLAPGKRIRTMLARTNGSNLDIPGRSLDFRNEVAWRAGLRAHAEAQPPALGGDAAFTMLNPIGSLNHNYPLLLSPTRRPQTRN